MDKTCRNKVCDGQYVQHLFLSQDLWPRHNVKGENWLKMQVDLSIT